MLYFFLIYLYCISLLSLVLVRKHILLILISLEFIVLSLLFFIYLFCLSISCSFYLYIFFICFYVCEGVLGLRVLVVIVRCFGNDYLNSIFIW